MTFRLPRAFVLTPLALLSSILIVACGSKPPAAPPPPEKPAAPPGPPPVVHSNAALEKCPQPLGSVIVSEDTGSIWYSQLRSYKLPPASALLRVLVQQSGCFVWIERPGAATTGKAGKAGKVESAAKPDFTLSPTISFTEAPASGGAGKAAPDATTTLTLQDNRSTVQLAETEGGAKYVDFNVFSPLFSAPNAGTGAYVKSPEGRVIAASFVDAYNLLVRAARNYQALNLKVPQPATVPSTRL